MPALELKVPPPVVALLIAAAMGGIGVLAPPIEVLRSIRYIVTAAFALAGGSFSLAGVISFRRARTTINPLKPETASSLVTAGVYRFTRNPMYVGLLLVLVAWAAFLASAWALAGPLAFVLFIHRFQIVPEERILAGVFGAQYAEYRAKVRRWL
jgi:protein-S-isoprenylcysteine O-methyltransferase Ste14